MAFGNNRAGKQPRAYFRAVGGNGTVIKFRHPYLAGAIDVGDTVNGNVIDEIDISSCCKLEGRYFEANQNMDSAKQVVLIDGSVCTISNSILAGTITMPIMKTTGLVASGDFIAACQLIKSIGDTVGGLLIKKDTVNGKVIVRVYYGVTVQRCPDDVCEGNDVAIFNVQLLYSGWIEAMAGNAADAMTKIWAVGSTNGLSAIFSSYNTLNTSGDGTGDSALSSAKYGGIDDETDADNGNLDTSQEVADVKDTTTTGAYGTLGIISSPTELPTT